MEKQEIIERLKATIDAAWNEKEKVEKCNDSNQALGYITLASLLQGGIEDLLGELE